MEQYKLPKNIRQIGDKEDWIRVYIEDYVHTYIQKLRNQQENSVVGGILLGRKQRINGTNHLFITGAAVAEDPFWKKPSQTPGMLRTESSVYFPGLEICGFFMSSRQSRTSEVELLRIFENYFNTEQQILLDIRGQEEDVFSYSGHSMVRLAGYYIYYEKNEEMQNYILRQDSFRAMESGRRADEEAVDFSREDELYAAARSGKKGGDSSRIMTGAGEKTAGSRKRLKNDSNVNMMNDEKNAANGVKDRSLPQKKSSQSGRWLGAGLFGGKVSGAGERDSGPGNGQKNRASVKENQTNSRNRVKKEGGGKWKKGDMVVRVVSISGIFVLAFLLFSDQIHLSKLDNPINQNSGISSVMGDKADITGNDSGISEVIRTGGEQGGINDIDGNAGNENESLQQPGNADVGKNGGQSASGSVTVGGNEGQPVSGTVADGGNGNQLSSGNMNVGENGDQSVSGSVTVGGNEGQPVSGTVAVGESGNQSVSGNVTGGESGNQPVSGSMSGGESGNQSVSGNVTGENSGGSLSSETVDNENNSSTANTHVFPMKYLVKKGDSLYSISEKYYGTIQMVDAICLENNITDPERVNYGVVLTLPEPPAN